MIKCRFTWIPFYNLQYVPTQGAYFEETEMESSGWLKFKLKGISIVIFRMMPKSISGKKNP